MSSSYARAASMFSALGNPTRLAILEKLCERPYCVQHLTEACDLPQPSVSQHLRVLRESDLVEVTRNGREMIYRISDEHVAHIVLDALRHADEDIKE